MSFRLLFRLPIFGFRGTVASGIGRCARSLRLLDRVGLSTRVIAMPRSACFSTAQIDPEEYENKEEEDIHVSVVADGSGLAVAFRADTQPGLFHAPWLWSNDPSHIHPSSGQRLRSPWTYYSSQARITSAHVQDHHIDDDDLPSVAPPLGSLHPVGGVYMGAAEISTDETRRLLHITWATNSGEKMKSRYDIDWLFRCRYDDDSLSDGRTGTQVTKENALQAGYSLQSLDYNLLLTDEKLDARFDLLHATINNGAAMVTGVPHAHEENDKAPVSVVAKMLSGGNISHGNLYGDLFSVKAETNARNIAYTSVALAPHQDLAYYESPPGLQLLHCIENSPGVKGGESVLIDALAAAEEFRFLAPDLFDILVQCDATFLKQREGGDMVYRRPHINLNASGTTVVSVHWSPPFEGPLAIASEQVEDYYVAYSAFQRMLDSSLPRVSLSKRSASERLLPMLPLALEADLCEYAHAFTWEQRLEPGEMLIFNNQRMLHGRRSFEMHGGDQEERGQRNLMGCYTNIDDTLNEYRLLRRQRFEHSRDLFLIRNVGNGSSSTN